MGKLSGLKKVVDGALDMSRKARMQRAKDMGFYDNVVYHGTASKPTTTMPDGNIFDKFTLWEGTDSSRSTVRSPVSKLGVSVGEQPRIAEDFASLASPDGSEGSAILPLKFRAERIGQIDMDEYAEGLTNDEVFGAVTDSWKDGYDAIQFRNYTTPGGEKGSFVLVREPSQLRSVNAAFDPIKKDSSNLLASMGGAAVLGGTALGSNEADAYSPISDFVQRRQAKKQHWTDVRDSIANLKPHALIEPAISPAAATLADYSRKYNKYVDSRPLLKAVAPEAPEALMRKIAYDDRRGALDYIGAGIGLAP